MADAVQLWSEDPVKTLWMGKDGETLLCCHCSMRITSADSLARTYSLKSRVSLSKQTLRHSKSILLAELRDELLLYDRHLDCLLQSTRFIAISHVWHKQISAAQHGKKASALNSVEVARDVLHAPALACRSMLNHGLSEELEFWHDYISVPQWRSEIKNNIIPAIPTIFEQADLVAVYASDLNKNTIDLMRHGATIQDRCKAMSRLCNIKWLSRVWTAMEFMKSYRICFLTHDYTFIAETIDHEYGTQNLVAEMARRWSNEVRQHGSAHEVEAMVDMGNNLVPWQLGPLSMLKWQSNQHQRCSFAMTYQVFARRGITHPRDFFRVLIGIVDTEIMEPMLSEDPQQALAQIASDCVLHGDLSPLFMIPPSSGGPPNAKPAQYYGYNYLDVFGLGEEQHAADERSVRLSRHANSLIMTAERIGSVQDVVYHSVMDIAIEDMFAILVRYTLEEVGDDLEDFVRTLGGHLYGQDANLIFLHLAHQTKTIELARRLTFLHGIWCGDGWQYSLDLSKKPVIHAKSEQEGLASMSNHFAIDLSECLGNDDGVFCMTMTDFQSSASQIRLEKTTLSAKLRTPDGTWKHAEVDIRILINNRFHATRDHLDWIATAMGLPDRSLNSKTTPLSPLEYLNSHGSTIHLWAHCAIMKVGCPGCGRCTLLRVATFEHLEVDMRLEVWSIPFLKYKFTLEGGAGVVLDKERIVGRLLWSTRFCDCFKLGEVDIVLNDIPLPEQNRFPYGAADRPGNLPVHEIM